MVTPQLNAALVVPDASTSHHRLRARHNWPQARGLTQLMAATASR